jgi:hypothetical protein
VSNHRGIVLRCWSDDVDLSSQELRTEVHGKIIHDFHHASLMSAETEAFSYDVYFLSAWHLKLEGQEGTELLFAHDVLQFYSDLLFHALTDMPCSIRSRLSSFHQDCQGDS